MSEKTWSMKERSASTKKTLVFYALTCTVLIVIALVIHHFSPSYSPVSNVTISEIVSDPVAWGNRTVKVEGTIRRTSLGVILPFNYWLCDRENQTMRIGVKWLSEADLSEKNVSVIGVVSKGYAWIHPDYPGQWGYFIEADSVC